MKQLIIKFLKEMSGGQSNLTPKQRLIFLWWAMSLTCTILFAECLWLCALAVGSLWWSSKYINQIPVGDDEDGFDLDENE